MKLVIAIALSILSASAFASDLQASNGGTAHPVQGTTVVLGSKASVRLYNALAVPAVANVKTLGVISCKRFLPTGAACVIGEIANAGPATQGISVFRAGRQEVEASEILITGQTAKLLFAHLNAEPLSHTGRMGVSKLVDLQGGGIFPLQGDGLICQQLNAQETECGLVKARN